MKLDNEIADIIETSQKQLIHSWMECVRTNVPASRDKSPFVLINHLREFFKNLIMALRHTDQEIQDSVNLKLSDEHGKQRARYSDYSINQIIQEYHLLRITVFDFLDDKAVIRKRERNIINEFIDDFIRVASASFSDELNRKLSDALKIRDEFINTISHELKTPLTSMKLHTQISKRYLANHPELQTLEQNRHSRGLIRFIDHNEKGINRLNHLVEDMLDISQINSGELRLEKEDFILSQAVDEVVTELGGFLSECHCEVTKKIPQDVHLVCDKFRFEQILSNLLSNAAKYGGEGPIELLAHVDAGEVVTIEVQDHGRGIAKKDQERIFQRFERVTSPGERKGLGLGLYIVRHLTDLLGGKIRIRSRPGHGSNFILQLPLHPA
ncbi:MAG TPA: HAMP domain-containing sensor histidine kinase [Bacteriovoracaceae bacterium]|nr:HAMP domain-containing sensor histidine kinase [Bacteriovoracaceae bacterium]